MTWGIPALRIEVARQAPSQRHTALVRQDVCCATSMGTMRGGGVLDQGREITTSLLGIPSLRDVVGYENRLLSRRDRSHRILPLLEPSW